MCMFCTSGAVESEKHFILECVVFKDIRESYGNMLASVSSNVFSVRGLLEIWAGDQFEQEND